MHVFEKKCQKAYRQNLSKMTKKYKTLAAIIGNAQ